VDAGWFSEEGVRVRACVSPLSPHLVLLVPAPCIFISDVCVSLSLCVCLRERERERGRVCVCVCVLRVSITHTHTHTHTHTRWLVAEVKWCMHLPDMCMPCMLLHCIVLQNDTMGIRIERQSSAESERQTSAEEEASLAEEEETPTPTPTPTACTK
jgi:hypothetical protein